MPECSASQNPALEAESEKRETNAFAVLDRCQDLALRKTGHEEAATETEEDFSNDANTFRSVHENVRYRFLPEDFFCSSAIRCSVALSVSSSAPNSLRASRYCFRNSMAWG